MADAGHPPPYKANPPPPYGDPPPPGLSPSQVVYQQEAPEPTIIITQPKPIAGACPVCQNTNWMTVYPCSAWFLAIFLFPVGILCCLSMSKKQCSKCGLSVSS